MRHQPLAGRAAKGALWLTSARLIAKSADAVTIIILARLLGPADFGLVAMAMSILLIVEAVLEVPVLQALMRQSTILQAHLDTAFTLGVIRSIILVLLMVIVSVPVARFNGEPRLTMLLIVLSSAPVIRGLSSPKIILFSKGLDFKREFLLISIGKVSAGVTAIVFAEITGSYWSLALGTIAGPVANSALSYFLAPYNPRLSLVEWRAFSHFIGWGLFSQILQSLNWQIDRILMGRYVTPSQLGHFSVSNDIVNVPDAGLLRPIAHPLSSSLYNISHDTNAVASLYLKTSATLASIGFPIYVGIAVLSPAAVTLVLGEGWDGTDALLKYLSLSYLPVLPIIPWMHVAYVLGRPQVVTISALCELALRLPAVWFMIVAFGATGASIARLIVNAALYLIVSFMIRQLTGLSLTKQAAVCVRPLLSVLLMLCIAVPLSRIILVVSGFQLVIGAMSVIACSAVVYVGSILSFWYLAGCPRGFEAVCFTYGRRMFFRVLSWPPFR